MMNRAFVALLLGLLFGWIFIMSGCGYYLAQKAKTYKCVSDTQMACEGTVCREIITKDCVEAQ